MLGHGADGQDKSQGGARSVSASGIAGLAIVVGVIGMFIGWNFRTARGANADLKVHKARIPGFRRVRNRNGLWSLVLIALTLLALSALVRG
jgi:hypothetical protein